MAANSFLRKVVKRALFSIFSEGVYSAVQAAAMAWDIRSGEWYEPEVSLIPHALRSGESALDIGANFGMYSYHLSRAVGTSGKVYAFEPVPFTNRTFQMVANLLGFKNVQLLPKACGDRAGNVTFTLPIQEAGSISAGLACVKARADDRPGRAQHVHWSSSREIVCDVVVIDEFLREVNELSFVKCDVEGFELAVFRGAKNLIERHCPTVVCEIDPWFLEGYNFQLSDLLEFFLIRNYLVYHCAGQRGKERLHPILAQQIRGGNYVFIHSSRLPRFNAVMAS